MNTNQSAGALPGDNGNLRAGVLTAAELDDLMETTWSESIKCPACDGTGDAYHEFFIAFPKDCEWCEGTGFCTRAVAAEWEEATR